MEALTPAMRSDAGSTRATESGGSTCVTCRTLGPGPFCPKCGQREFRGRHTLRGFAAGALQRVIGEDGALHTVRQLTVHPGQVIRDYLSGRTVRYVHPLAYLLLAVALFTLVGRVLVGPTGAPESDRLWLLLVIPFVAAASRICFWRGRYNYAEHLIAVMYLGAQSLLVLTLLYWGIVVVPQSFAGTYAIACLSASAAWYVWGYTRVFDRRPWLAAAASLVSIMLGSAVWLGAVTLLVGLLRK